MIYQRDERYVAFCHTQLLKVAQNVWKSFQVWSGLCAISGLDRFLWPTRTNPINLVNRRGFQQLITYLEPGYRLPSDTHFTHLVECKYVAVKAEVCALLEHQIDCIAVTAGQFHEKWNLRSNFKTSQILTQNTPFWSPKHVVLGFTISFSIFCGLHLIKVACTTFTVWIVSVAIFGVYQWQIISS